MSQINKIPEKSVDGVFFSGEYYCDNNGAVIGLQLILKKGVHKHHALMDSAFFIERSTNESPIELERLVDLRFMGHAVAAHEPYVEAAGLISERVLEDLIWNNDRQVGISSLVAMRRKLGSSAWGRLGRIFDKVCENTPEARRAFWSLVSVELSGHIFDQAWYAALVVYARDALRSEFLTGLFFSELLHSVRSQEHFDRGERLLKAAVDGGVAKSLITDPEMESIVDEMRRTIGKRERFVSRAAQIVFERGFGRSPAANRRLWYRRVHGVETERAKVSNR